MNREKVSQTVGLHKKKNDAYFLSCFPQPRQEPKENTDSFQLKKRTYLLNRTFVANCACWRMGRSSVHLSGQLQVKAVET